MTTASIHLSMARISAMKGQSKHDGIILLEDAIFESYGMWSIGHFTDSVLMGSCAISINSPSPFGEELLSSLRKGLGKMS